MLRDLGVEWKKNSHDHFIFRSVIFSHEKAIEREMM